MDRQTKHARLTSTADAAAMDVFLGLLRTPQQVSQKAHQQSKSKPATQAIDGVL
jgi:hypothetical protein